MKNEHFSKNQIGNLCRFAMKQAYLMAKKYCFSKEDAQDFCNEMGLLVCTMINEKKLAHLATEDSVRAYIFTTIRNNFYDCLKARKKQNIVDLEDIEDAKLIAMLAKDSIEEMENSEIHRRQTLKLQEIMSRELTPYEKEIITAIFAKNKGETDADIAAEFNVLPNYFKQLKKRAMDKLKKYFKNDLLMLSIIIGYIIF